MYVCPLLASVARTGKGIEGISIMLSLCNGEVIYVYRSHTIRGARESAISDAKGVILNIQYCTHQKRSHYASVVRPECSKYGLSKVYW